MAQHILKAYDKIALLSALIITLSLGAVIYLNGERVDRDFPALPTTEHEVPENLREEDTRQTGSSLESDNSMRPSPPLFTGEVLFVKTDGTLIDLNRSPDAPVHPPIPNKWWVRYGLDPSFSDAPQRDPDGDGFSNLEEYNGKTDPTDFGAHPPLIDKLKVAELKDEQLTLKYLWDDNYEGPVEETDQFNFRVIQGRRGPTNSSGLIPAGQGPASIFCRKVGPGHLRFELQEVTMVEKINPSNKVTKPVYTATVIDKRPNKAGRPYRIEKGSRNGTVVTDYTAHLYLDAINQAGVPIVVEENGTFSLPFDPKAPHQPFTFRGVNEANQVVIEWKEGDETRERLLAIQN